MNEPLPQHGGKRANSGRKKGSTHASNATKLQFRELVRAHSKSALNALVAAANDPENTQRVQAATVLIQYAYGRPGSMVIQEPDIADIMNKLKSSEISARDAAFEIEASGSPLPEIVKMTLAKELGLDQIGNYQQPDYAKLDLLYLQAEAKADEDQAALVGRGEEIEGLVNEAKAAKHHEK
jgi:hypothetical protein